MLSTSSIPALHHAWSGFGKPSQSSPRPSLAFLPQELALATANHPARGPSKLLPALTLLLLHTQPERAPACRARCPFPEDNVMLDKESSFFIIIKFVMFLESRLSFDSL